MSRPTYQTADRYPLMAAAIATGTLLVLSLLLTFMMGSVMQWRNDVKTKTEAAAAERIQWDMRDPAIVRIVQVGALR
jgi:hypothetical protein